MTLGLLCMGLIAMLFGLAVVFYGYRMFLFLLPIWGFFFGFFLGAQTIQILLDDPALLGTVTSWIVGFFAGLVFAVLAYLFYFIAVGIISFSLGYAGTYAILGWIGLDTGFVLWLIAVIVGIALALVVYYFNIQKYAIIVATAVAGTGAITYVMLVLIYGYVPTALFDNPVQKAIDESFWWLLFFIVIAGLGIIAQVRQNRDFEIETYNRMEAYT